jgi:hypothetical protein
LFFLINLSNLFLIGFSGKYWKSTNRDFDLEYGIKVDTVDEHFDKSSFDSDQADSKACKYEILLKLWIEYIWEYLDI